MYRTTFGGVITMILALALIIFFSLKANILFTYGQTISKRNEFLFDADASTDKMYFRENEVYLMISLHDTSYKKYYLDKKYGYFKATLISSEKTDDPNNPRTRSFESIDLIPCDNETLGIKQNDIINNYNLSQFLCPETNLYVQGLSLSDTQARTFISYYPCKDKDYCANDTEIEDFYSNAMISLMFGDRWFDQNNFTSPLQTYFQTDWKPIQKGYLTLIGLYLRNNTVNLQDSYLGIQSQTFNFLKFEEKVEYQTHLQGSALAHGGNLFRILVALSREQVIYERQIYNVNNLLADVGGFFNSLLFLGSIFFYAFKQQIFFASLLTKVYLNHNMEKNRIFIANNQTSKAFDNNLYQFETSGKQLDKQTSRYESLVSYLSSINNSTSQKKCRFVKLTFQRVIGLFICKNKHKNFIKDQFYFEGKNQLIDELDLVSVLKKLRKVDVLYQLLLDPKLQALGSLAGSTIKQSKALKTEQNVKSDHMEFSQLKEYILQNKEYFSRSLTKKKQSKMINLLLEQQPPENEINNDQNFQDSRPQLVNAYDQVPAESLRKSQILRFSAQNKFNSAEESNEIDFSKKKSKIHHKKKNSQRHQH